MKRIGMVSVVVAAGLLGLTACESSTRTEPATTQANMGIINEYCPGMPDHPVDPSVQTASYNGYEVGFCCPGCIAAWDDMSDSDKSAFVDAALSGN